MIMIAQGPTWGRHRVYACYSFLVMRSKVQALTLVGSVIGCGQPSWVSCVELNEVS